MATSKTLNPTNVSISIPALGDAPDASVFSNCIDKEADAINALNSQLVFTYTTPTKTTDSKWASGTITLRKRSGIVQIKLDGATLTQVSARETIATVPSGYIPSTETYFSDSTGARTFLIDTSGNIKANAQSAGQVWGTGMYIVEN